MPDNSPTPYEITLLRHGQSVGNAESRWQGQADYPLTEKGRAQAHALADYWFERNQTFDLILASPQIRAKDTAQIIAQALNIPIEFDDVWRERFIGAAAGLTHEELHQKIPQPEFRTPYEGIGDEHGEGNWELFLRAGTALHNLLKRPPARYLVVSHGGLLNQFMHAVLGIIPQANDHGVRFRFGNTGYARLVYFPHKHTWQVVTVNNRAHLKDN
ncbi:MAG: histidine phosphatase family protein [Anaerolineales bacterium]